MKNNVRKIVAHLRRFSRFTNNYKLQVANFEGLMFRPRGLLHAVYAEASTPSIKDDRALVSRICNAYSSHTKENTGRSMWSEYFMAYHADVNRILLGDDSEAAAHLLQNPALSNIFYGFDILNKDYIGYFKSKLVQEAYADLCLDGLIRFAEAVGAVPLYNPEASSGGHNSAPMTESIISNIQDTLKWTVDSPNFYVNEPGLASAIGVISYRVPQAMFQAWRIKQLVAGIEQPRVLEIGAGLGRTAYYARQLGIKDYTIVDLPVSTAAQAYFLGRVLGDDCIQLEEEPTTGGLEQRVKIISPATFRNLNQRFDLIVNFDSFTEMDAGVAAEYWQKSKALTSTVLSVNHEANPHRVRDLYKDDRLVASSERLSYWMRRGYVEEIVRWK